MEADTIIVNGYDLIWEDHTIGPGDLDCFFFKEDPVKYLLDLNIKGWDIIIYWPYPTKMGFTYKEGGLNTHLTDIYELIEKHFEHFARFRFETNNNDNIANNIDLTRLSPASFIISNTILSDNIPNYGVKDIFGFVENPSLLTNTQYFIISDSKSHIERLEAGYGAIYISFDRNERYGTIAEYVKNNPGINVVIIWSPVYRYDNKDDYIKFSYYKEYFNRPDKDSYDDLTKRIGDTRYIPSIQWYTYGY